jgi:integrase/recombinase XerD
MNAATRGKRSWETLDNRKYIEQYLDYIKLKQYSSRTLDTYRRILDSFLNYLQAKGKRICDLTRSDLKDYQSDLYYQEYQGKPLGIKTQCLRLSTVRMLFKYLAAENLILTNPAVNIELPKEPKRLPRVILTAKEAAKILENIDTTTVKGIRDRAIFEIMYSSGLRIDELIHLTIEALNFEQGLLTVEKGKGAKERVVPIGKSACYWVKEYLEKIRPRVPGNPYLFLSIQSSKRLTRSVIDTMCLEYTNQVGIKKHVTPHTFRHTCATLMLKGGADIRYVQELLGHASLKTTQIYTKVTIQDLKKVHARCHPHN